MPTPEQIITWAKKLELNPEEVSHWFRCKWRIKLMSPFLQGASNMPPSNNGSVTSTENGSYSRTDTGSDGAQGEKDNDDFINIECETIVEEVAQDQSTQQMAISQPTIQTIYKESFMKDAFNTNSKVITFWDNEF